MDYRALGKRVRQQRRITEFTQEELAEKTGVSCSFIGHIERGEKKASLETLVALCNAMHVTPTVLLQDSVDPDVVNSETSGRLVKDLLQVLREHNVHELDLEEV